MSRGEPVIACEPDGLSSAEQGRWTRYPVDPIPPWWANHPSPLNWRDQLVQVVGEGDVNAGADTAL